MNKLNWLVPLFKHIKKELSNLRFRHNILNIPSKNKGLGFTMEERQILGIHGLLPAQVKTLEEQLLFSKLSLNSFKSPISKYIYMNELSDRNEKLFYCLLHENIEELMPIIYTPTVGIVCQKFGLLYRRARGLFITIHDKGNILTVLKNWHVPNVKFIVVTDGERILGLGDLGAHGMGIPVGKLALYTAFAKIDPQLCLPITLDVGTNNKELLTDPLYVGLRQERVTGEKYEEFVDEFMEACIDLYGTTVLIQFEDFGSNNAFYFLEKYRNLYCTFNDDIQGTAAVALAGLIGATRITKKKLTDNTILFYGAGGAANGIAQLILQEMQRKGLSKEQAISRIWMVDIKGLLVKNRNDPASSIPRMKFAKDVPPLTDLVEIIKFVRPSAIIGVSTSGGAFNPNVLQTMAKINKRPIIFALSNPTRNAECTAQEAYEHTDGRCIFASGSPFPEVHYKDKTYYPGQGNNCYIFPGVGLGVMLAHMQHIPEDVFIIAAEVLAKSVKQQDLDLGRVYPPIKEILDVSTDMAIAIMNYAFDNNLASIFKPKDIKKYIEKHQYSFEYESSIQPTWNVPEPTRMYKMDKNWNPPDLYY